MSLGAILAGNAIVRISGDQSGLDGALESSERSVEDWGRSLQRTGAAIMGVGGVITGAMAMAASSFMNAADEIDKMSQRTGIATDELQAMRHMMELSGGSAEGIEVMIRRMQRGITDAGDELGTATRAFERIGITFDELQGRSPDQQFHAIARAIAEVEDPTVRAAAAQEIFGRQGTNVLAMIRGGIGDYDALHERASDNIQLTEAQIAAGVDMTDMWYEAKEAIAAIWREVGSALMPHLLSLSEWLRDNARGWAMWVRENERVIIVIASVGVALLGLGAGIVALGTVLRNIIVLKAALTASTIAYAAAIALPIAALVLLADAFSGGQLGIISFIEDMEIGGARIGDIMDIAATAILRSMEWAWMMVRHGFWGAIDFIEDLFWGLTATVYRAMDSVLEAIESAFNWIINQVRRVPLLGRFFGETGDYEMQLRADIESDLEWIADRQEAIEARREGRERERLDHQERWARVAEQQRDATRQRIEESMQRQRETRESTDGVADRLGDLQRGIEGFDPANMDFDGIGDDFGRFLHDQTDELTTAIDGTTDAVREQQPQLPEEVPDWMIPRRPGHEASTEEFQAYLDERRRVEDLWSQRRFEAEWGVSVQDLMDDFDVDDGAIEDVRTQGIDALAGYARDAARHLHSIDQQLGDQFLVTVV